MIGYLLWMYVAVGAIIGGVTFGAIKSLQWMKTKSSDPAERLKAGRELALWDESAQTIGFKNRYALPPLVGLLWLPMFVMAAILKSRK